MKPIVSIIMGSTSDLPVMEKAAKLLAAELEKLLRPCERKFAVAEGKRPFVILMAGVNGAGKTTTIGKLATKLKAQGHCRE